MRYVINKVTKNLCAGYCKIVKNGRMCVQYVFSEEKKHEEYYVAEF